MNLDRNYWNTRYLNNETAWDLQMPSPTIVQYFLQENINRESSILIPGCGNAHEAKALMELGYQNITVVDIAPVVVEKLKQDFKEYASISVYCEDFFELKNSFHYIVEQTFFCALDRNLRENYVRKMHELLQENGKIIGVLFASEFTNDGPPFGGTIAEYKTLFEQKFELHKLEICYNSSKPRAGNELFIEFQKKNRI